MYIACDIARTTLGSKCDIAIHVMNMKMLIEQEFCTVSLIQTILFQVRLVSTEPRFRASWLDAVIVTLVYG